MTAYTYMPLGLAGLALLAWLVGRRLKHMSGSTQPLVEAEAHAVPIDAKAHGEELYLVGIQACRDRQFQQAARAFALAADLGHARAQLHFGLLCEHGIGLEANLERAYHWYRRAAAQGDVDAYFRCRVVMATRVHEAERIPGSHGEPRERETRLKEPTSV